MDNQLKKISAWLGTGSINIFGRPFAGKDTQGRLLAETFGGVLVAGGDILRHYHDQEELEKIMSAGGNIPSNIYLKIVLPFLSRQDFKEQPLILSEVGRIEGEEQTIMEAATRSGHPIKAVILLQLTEKEALRRFEESLIKHDRGDRADDHRQVIQNRLQKYQDKIVPVIEFYRDRGMLIEVDGTLSPEDVTVEILNSLAGRALQA
jgi:adenylate kinase